jgi:hypothetical protein
MRLPIAGEALRPYSQGFAMVRHDHHPVRQRLRHPAMADSMEDFRPFGGLPINNERLGHHVVERLLLSGEGGHDEADQENESGNVLREMSSGSAGE